MEAQNHQTKVLAVKDANSERPIPDVWRPVIKAIVRALSHHDYRIGEGVAGVQPVSDETAEQIRRYIAGYGEVLTELPDETWRSSACIWNGRRWDALIDLWTVGEGRSDLVLSVQVTESEGAFAFAIYMVYVP